MRFMSIIIILFLIVLALWFIDRIFSKYYGFVAVESRRRAIFRRELAKARSRKRWNDIWMYVLKTTIIMIVFIVGINIILYFHQNGF